MVSGGYLCIGISTNNAERLGLPPLITVRTTYEYSAWEAFSHCCGNRGLTLRIAKPELIRDTADERSVRALIPQAAQPKERSQTI